MNDCLQQDAEITIGETGDNGTTFLKSLFRLDADYFYMLKGGSNPIISLGGDKFSVLELQAPNAVSSGLIEGGRITIDTAFYSQRVNISAGTGIIVNYDDPIHPVSTRVNFGPFDHVSMPDASVVVTHFTVDVNGNLTKHLVAPDEVVLHDEICLGSGVVIDPTSATVVFTEGSPAHSYGIPQATVDFLRFVIGPANISGNVLSANSDGNLTWDRSAGKTFALGTNPDDSNQLHIKDSSAVSPVALFTQDRRANPNDNENLAVTFRTTIDPNNYDNNGVLTAVPNNKFTVQRINFFPADSGTDSIYYGRKVYNGKADAIAGIQTEDFVESSQTIVTGGLLLGFLVVRQGTTNLTDLTDAEFFQATSFRLTGSAGFSPGSISAIGVRETSQGTVFTGVTDILFHNGAEGSGFYITPEASNENNVIINFHDHVVDILAGEGINLSETQAGAAKTITVNAPNRFYLEIADQRGNSFGGIKKINFGEDFYVNQNDPNTDEVIVEFAGSAGGGGGGEDNTASNLGTGEGIFFQKAGVDLELKSLLGASGIRLTSTDDEITLSADQLFYLTVADQLGNSFGGLKKLNFGAGFYTHQNDPNTDEVVINLDQIKGDKGDTGDQGIQGDQGEQGPGFYQVVKLSDDSASFGGIEIITFDADDFYVGQNDPNTDEVVISSRGIKLHASAHESGGNDPVNHDSLDGFLAAEHIDWALTGAEDIHDDRIAESSVTQHQAAIDHDALLNFVADEHVAHAGVDLTAGIGLTGGGNIAASRTFDLDIDGLTEETAIEHDADFIPIFDTSGAVTRKVKPENLQGKRFYLTVADQKGNSFGGIKKINFGDLFYVHQNFPNTDEVIVDSTGGGGAGEVNTASNLAGDEGIFFQKVGADLELKALTGGTNITLSSTDAAITIDAAGGGGGGKEFYLVIAESGGRAFTGVKKINFGTDFYVGQSTGNTDEVEVVFKSTPLNAKFDSRAFVSATEWEFPHNFNEADLMWNAYDDADEAIIPARVDISDPNTTFFYFDTAVAGKAVLTSFGNIGDPTAKFDAQAFASASEWEYNHGFNSNKILWNVYDDLDEAIIPAKVDISDPNTAYFYFAEAEAGSAVLAAPHGVTIQSPKRFSIATFTSQTEWEVLHGFNQTGLLWASYDEADRAIIPAKLDVSDPAKAYFYWEGATTGTAVMAASGGASKVAQTFGSSLEWEMPHKMGTSDIVWSTYNANQEAIIPAKVDVSDPNVAYFYWAVARAGRAVLV